MNCAYLFLRIVKIASVFFMKKSCWQKKAKYVDEYLSHMCSSLNQGNVSVNCLLHISEPNLFLLVQYRKVSYAPRSIFRKGLCSISWTVIAISRLCKWSVFHFKKVNICISVFQIKLEFFLSRVLYTKCLMTAFSSLPVYSCSRNLRYEVFQFPRIFYSYFLRLGLSHWECS